MARYGSRASNLSGLLGSIGSTIGEMGKPGEQYIDTFRRSMAPEADLGDSQSLLNYSEWAKRNGYDDEAEKYLALGYKQKAAEGEKNYKTRVATDTEKLRAFNKSISNLEQAVANGDVNAEIALERVKDAQRQHISAMNSFGEANDYGTGNEGGVAERALNQEGIAAQDARLKRRKLIGEITNMEAELAESISEGEPIDLSLLPPAVRDKYERASAAALASDTPLSAMQSLNATFRSSSENYISGLAKGDGGTKVLLAEAKKGLRDLDSDLADFFADSDNTAVLDLVMQAAESELLQDPTYRLMSKDEQKVEAREVFIRLLRAESEEFDREYKGAYRTAEGGQNSAEQTAKDLDRRYDAGMEPGGDEYKAAVARARRAKGENFDQQAFDASWDRRFYNPFGATTMPAPVY